MLLPKLRVNTKIKDRGAKHILKQIDTIGKGIEITSGIHSPQGDMFAYWNGKKESDAPLAQYAYWNEYGTEKIPRRPALRLSMARNTKRFEKNTITGMRSIYAGNQTTMRLVRKMRQRTERWTKTSIRQLRSPVNATVTLSSKKRKRQGKDPLIATKTYLNSIQSRINKRGKGRNKLKIIDQQVMKDLMRINRRMRL